MKLSLVNVPTVCVCSNRKREIEGCSKHALHFFAGLLAGVSAVSLTYPLDRARAVMAVTNVGAYKNLQDVFRRTFREEGCRAMYRGFAPAIIGVVPYAGVSFTTYETLKGMCLSSTDCKVAIDRTELDQLSDLSPLWRLLFGATAGVLGQFTSYPLDIVRRRMQTARQMGVNGNRYSSILGTLIYIYRKEGISRGWYKGISMNFIKGPIAVGTSFTINDYCKIAFSKLLLKTQSPRQDKE
jgi:solute carrier family 25 protein 42